MLVLTRKYGETINMPALGVKITVVRIDAGSVRIGIEAPEDVKIMRGEHLKAMEVRDEKA